MRKIWDFNGGIHPAENKTQSTGKPIQSLPLPAKLIIPVQQHIGNAPKVCVQPGEHVKKGQIIAEAEGFISANVHASSSGIIESIAPASIAHPSAMQDLCITLIPDGKDEWLEAPLDLDYEAMKPAEILQRVREAGIAGMGGAGFPTEVKLHPPRQDKVRTLILNAAECEPYITSDDMLMRERAEEVIKGLDIMAQVLTPENCIIGIEDNKPEAAEALRHAARNTRIEIVVIPTKYPSGGEKQLIKILTGEEVPSGSIPADIGVMCQNVATAAAVYNAVAKGRPLISRITTVTGEAVTAPGNYEVLNGTPISELLRLAGADLAKASRVIVGGPMMGFTLLDIDSPVVKTTSCVLVATEEELPLPPPAQACIRCGFCVEACPMELLPQQLFWFSQSDNFEQAEQYNIMDCIECGACSYVCPSSIPLVQHYRYAKGKIREQKQDQAKSDKARERFEFRLFRQEREKEEKEANRKARAEAAAKAQAAKKAAASASPKEGAAEEDPRKAAIAAALARSNAKKTVTAEPQQNQPKATENAVEKEPVDTEAMKAAIDKLKAKIDKLKITLSEMAPDNTDAIAKTQRAIDKNVQRLAESENALQEALAEANKQDSQPSPAEEKQEAPDLATLEEQVKKADSKCEKMQSALDDAKANGSDTTKLERAVEKNKSRLAQAVAALDAAKSASTEKEDKV